MNPEKITIVSGLPRSGTSLMMQILTAGGLPALTDQLRQPDENNPRGYFEFEPVKRLRSDQSWLPQARGKVVKIIHLLLRDLPMDGSYCYQILFMTRPIAEVLASQQAMLQREGKTSAQAEVLKTVFEKQLAELDAWLGVQNDVSLLKMNYHQLIHQPAGGLDDLCQFLNLNLDKAAMHQAIDPMLYRQKS